MRRLRRATDERSTLAVAGWLVVATTALLIPFGGAQIGETASFMPALISVVTCFDLLSVYLLIGGYRDKGELRLLVMAAAYTWSLVMMLGYALAFPGAISQHPPLGAVPSTAPYLYLAWHGGFPLLLGVASAPWPQRILTVTAPSDRTRRVLQVIPAALLTGITLVIVVSIEVTSLPALIVGLDTSRMTALTAPVILPLVLASLVVSRLGPSDGTGPERWCTVAILVCACDLVLTYGGGKRFSLGWYGGRILTLVAAGVVVFSMLATFRRLAAQSEHDAVHDALTGLANRRYAYVELGHLVARARRSARPLGVISIDLDHFKQINDHHGHDTGDCVLRVVGQALARDRRAGDVVARVGGEEFLVLLPDADQAGTTAVAEGLRENLSSLLIPGLDRPLTASLGATTLLDNDKDADGGDLLRRVDDALYAAKHAGRNRVVVADPQAWPRLTAVDDAPQALSLT